MVIETRMVVASVDRVLSLRVRQRKKTNGMHIGVAVIYWLKHREYTAKARSLTMAGYQLSQGTW